MENKIENVKVENTEKKVSTDEKNLSNLLEKAKKFQQVQKQSSKKSGSLFKDNSYLSAIDGGKKFRKDKRKELKNLCAEINANFLLSKKDELKKSIEKFIEYYKKTYSINDFSITSIYQGSNLHPDYEFYTTVLEVVKLNISK
jgi:hypothetical protein